MIMRLYQLISTAEGPFNILGLTGTSKARGSQVQDAIVKVNHIQNTFATRSKPTCSRVQAQARRGSLKCMMTSGVMYVGQ